MAYRRAEHGLTLGRFVVGIAAIGIGAVPAYAQTAASPATADPEGDIVVTARKRAEPLQRVPISADVIAGSEIASQGIASIQDLTATLPAVRLAKGTTTNRQFIRGIGSGDNPNFEQSVGTFIDDIYHGRARTSEASLFDIDRIEVLKGPQTTYFGNNAIAGALNIATVDPGRVVAGQARISYTPTLGLITGEAAIDIPASDTLAVRIAGIYSSGHGWIDDLGDGHRVPRTRGGGVRGTLLWKPTDNFTARLKAQYVDDLQKGGLPIVRGNCPPAAAFGGPTGFCALAIATNAGPASADFTRDETPGQFSRLRSQDYVATLNWDHGPFVVTSVTGYNRYTYGLVIDLDTTPAPLLSVSAPERYSQVSQEVRITSDQSRPIEYIAGVYYQHGDLRVRNTLDYAFLNARVTATPAFAALIPYLPLGVNNEFRQQDETLSAFGALTWKLGPSFRVTGALRYTHVSKDLDRAIYVGSVRDLTAAATPLSASDAALAARFASAAGLANAGATALSRSDGQFQPSVTVQYEVDPRIMLYGRFDHGFKAGGFNGVDLTSPASALSFDPEKVDAFEAGAKTKLLDNRLTLNIDYFHSKYTNLQLAGIVPSAAGSYVNRVQNAGGAITQGVELEASLRVDNRLRVSLTATYLDAHYSRYANATPTALQTRAGQVSQDLSGASTPYAPRWSGTWAVSYSVPIANGLTLRFDNQLYASTAFFLNFNNDPYARQNGYAREDLTVTLASDRGWELSAVGKNLTDHVIRSYGAALPTSLGSYVYISEQPRTVAIQARYRF